ncbi:MAG: succinate dehydrogenase, cytochrome b556 subunit [Pseudomonadota bacterium]
MSQKNARPLSPHITVYRPQITSVMSILHRITGCGLALSLVFFVWFIIALAMGESSYNLFIYCSTTLLGKLVVFMIVFALFYHMFNGIRHLVWDTGYGYNIQNVKKSGIIVAILAVVATIITSVMIAV